MIVVSRCIERIGDNAVDIGEQTAFLVTGEFEEFTDASRRSPKPHQTFTSGNPIRRFATETLLGETHDTTWERRGNTMNRALALVLVLALVAAGATMAVQTQPAAARSTAGSLVGTGATFPFPLISKWIPAVDEALGIRITYSPTGSGAGIAQITARTVDFGASDAPLTPDQLSACNGVRRHPLGARQALGAVQRARNPGDYASTARCSRTSTWARSRTGMRPRSRPSIRP